ncbi:hypothetical protein VE02_04690 [Pseudogymnoascus sp. 03VT05]|nr:hypothetical protein VE02_04690 [Pseudogymnoascus sp. 03VT05]
MVPFSPPVSILLTFAFLFNIICAERHPHLAFWPSQGFAYSVYPHRRKLLVTRSAKSPIPTADQAKAAASKMPTWRSVADRAITKIVGTGGRSSPPTVTAAGHVGPSTRTVANPILNAALLDGIRRHQFRTGERMSKFLTVPRAQAARLFYNLIKYSGSIIRNPNDRLDRNLPEFFARVSSGRTEQRWREMTGAELEEVGFSYGEDLEVLEMQGMKLLGWVAEVEDDEETAAIKALWGPETAAVRSTAPML